ncbi:MAG: malonic semialdehyde reductase [Sphingomonas sp.]|jgi:3-hydroxypropanoate dehydrogenase|uniref:malonic semialdehyde reductase n=1 Tax=Sphingomonas sp. TaxID=28214 RepID=UPI0025CFEB04|nr:malonic semialdehyde reductase [Sphingomonas sp.]MBX9882209.1 malonic semialdehyde reductase [Sphingomonas sp.]
MHEKLGDAALDRIFREARTANGYTDAPFTEADAHAIWELVKFGPTSANQLPARFIWCLSQESRDRLAAHASGTNAPKIKAAPAAVIVAMDENFHEHLPELFPHTDAKSWFEGNLALRQASAMRNATLQGAYLIIAARALGFDVGPMSGFNNAALDADFFADTPQIKSNFIATLGVGDPATIFPRSPRPPFARFNSIA